MPRIDPRYPRNRQTFPVIPEDVSPGLRKYLNGLARTIQDHEFEYLVGSRMVLSADQAVAGGGALASLLFDTAEYDGGETSDETNGRIYARVAGIWHFDATAAFEAAASGVGSVVIVYSDGDVAAQAGPYALDAVNFTAFSCSCDVYLDQDDYMEVLVAQTSGAPLDVLADISSFNGRFCRPLRE